MIMKKSESTSGQVPISDSEYRVDMLGAQVVEGGVRFRVWAPKARCVNLLLADGRMVSLERDSNGYFFGTTASVFAGMTYRYRLDDGNDYPDPCSRFQPEGPHGPSQIVDHAAYIWKDGHWPGVRMAGQVLYELHIGTFTEEGTFDAAITRLGFLKRLGITLVEVMPVAEFPGRWNWGYDGACWFAPSHRYGDYDAFKRFVDAAHQTGLGVLLDVVYNHVAPEGNYLAAYSDDYTTDRYPNEWGKSVNFDGPGSPAVRDMVVQNACYWIEEFHLDGFRIDATQSMHDAGDRHILAELSTKVRRAAGSRPIVLIAENEPQDIRAIRPINDGGWGLDAMWSDDFHHLTRVAATGNTEAYLADYRGAPQEFISVLKRGFLYQGQRSHWQQKARGTVVSHESADRFVFYLQNHDQIGNTLNGARLHTWTSPGRYRALTAVWLLAPQTPMFFMGQERCASTPFLFFADFAGSDLGAKVEQGRKQFLAQFPSYASPEAQAAMMDPNQPLAFERSHLDWGELDELAPSYRLHADLLRLRREDPVFSGQARHQLDGAVLASQAFVIRYVGATDGDRLLLVNLGPDLRVNPVPEPLLAPPPTGEWNVMWSSRHPHYGGPGTVNPLTDHGWSIPAESATVFRVDPAVAEEAHPFGRSGHD